VDDPGELMALYKQLKVGGTRQGNGETYQQLSKLLGGGYVGLKNKPGLSGPGGSVSVGPSVDVKIAGVPVRKIKSATHKTKK
jgi:hypothetical protein